MGTQLSICSNSKEDPEDGPAAYIEYDERQQRLYH